MTTAAEAYNDTMAKFKAQWDTTGLPCKYPDIVLDTPMQAAIDTGLTAWARVTYLPNTRTQTSISGPTKAKFTAEGVVIVQIFTPTGDGGVLARTLYTLVEKAFEQVATLNGVWYRNTRTNPVPGQGQWVQNNVTSEWSYDEVR